VKAGSGAKASGGRQMTGKKQAARIRTSGESAKNHATVVKKILKKVEQKLSADDVKASLGDYIRLVQLHKELDEEAPREIKVTWVEPKGTLPPETDGAKGQGKE
jgi:acid stress-induced BolA-like protein IbaG/YrbA